MLLVPTEKVILSSEYESEAESNTGSVLLAYQLSQPILPPHIPSIILLLLPLYIMSQYSLINYELLAQLQVV